MYIHTYVYIHTHVGRREANSGAWDPAPFSRELGRCAPAPDPARTAHATPVRGSPGHSF